MLINANGARSPKPLPIILAIHRLAGPMKLGDGALDRASTPSRPGTAGARPAKPAVRGARKRW
jgi:hypothetical protein